MLAILLGVTRDAQAAPVCPSAPNKTITIAIATVIPTVKYRNDQTRAHIDAMARQHKSLHGIAIGLTVTDEEFRFASTGETRSAANGPTCLYLNGVQGQLEMRSITVYVASEYRPGSCEYNAIYEHEQEHVRINQDLVRRYAKRFEDALHDSPTLKALNPMMTASVGDGRHKLGATVNSVVQPIMAAMKAEQIKLNGAIDTPQSYRVTRARCTHW